MVLNLGHVKENEMNASAYDHKIIVCIYYFIFPLPISSFLCPQPVLLQIVGILYIAGFT